ncbi:hypothetical protein [Pseudoalteromonas sp. PA2MD11]|uniref:hypothetical protein n=1 Tax=Pseudoalteromonas sp. PA2MD11 TaxID=2785057 RepID=UPI001ADFA223|nr:hypothetical protein [Pseudoalteromonas sp. PA2MD11]
MKFLTPVILLMLTACSTVKLDQNNGSKPTLVEIAQKVTSAKVIILTDHTLPGHLNLSSGGAADKERLFIDPAADVFAQQLSEHGLKSTILKVEDMIPEDIITTKEQFDQAYANYDQLLKQAVAQGDTIISLHFDADIIMGKDYKDNQLYIGGVQIILDERAVSPETFKLSYYLLHDYPLFDTLNSAGFRTRPGYQDKPRYQNNLTLNITGHSSGGGILLELAPQEQAIRLYDTPENTAHALIPALSVLAKAVSDFRKYL